MGWTALAVCLIYLTFAPDPNSQKNAPAAVVSNPKADSLQTVVDSLQAEIEVMDRDFDSRENRYKDVLSEYEFGISYIERHHPEAFQDFHRIISFEEKYKRSSMRENKKRLNAEKY